MKKLYIGLAAWMIWLSGVSHASADYIVTPGPSVSLNITPFGGTDDVRYQQVYAASLFTQVSVAGQPAVTGPIEIIGLAFSPNQDGVYTANVTIGLDQTTTAVGSLSTNLDSNITGSLTTVLDNPSFSESVIGGDLTYSLHFDFSTPFIYDPTTGDNLLLDVTVKNKTDGWAFYRGDGQGVTSRATADFSDNVGLRTLIEFQPANIAAVPEPSRLILCLTGMVFGVIGYGCKRLALAS